MVACSGENKASVIQNCECNEFRPYRIAREGDAEVIEKQIPEVIEE
jgi:hypothetical protein